jgi:hypothetical protein
MRFINATITRGDQVKRKFKIAMVKPLPLSHYSAIIGVGTDWPRNLWTWRASCFPLKKQPSLSISLSLESRALGMHIYLLASSHLHSTNLKAEKPKRKGKQDSSPRHERFCLPNSKSPTIHLFSFYLL